MKRLKRLIWTMGGVLLAVMGPILYYTQSDFSASFRGAKGQILRDSVGSTVTKGGAVFCDVEVWNNRDDRMTLRVSTPAPECGRGPWPAVIFVPDVGSGRELIDSLPPQRNRILMAIDWPSWGKFDTSDRKTAFVSAWRARNAIIKQVSHTLLAGDYLAPQVTVRKGGVTLVGIGTGAFVSLAAAASDEHHRFNQVALIQAGIDLRQIIEASAERLQLPCTPSQAGLIGDWLFKPLDPSRYIVQIAPRSLIMLNGKQDAVIAPTAAQQLFDMAVQPKQLMWVDGTELAVAGEAETVKTVSRVLALLPAGTPTPSLSQETVKKAIDDISAMTKAHKYAEAERARQKALKQWSNEEDIKKQLEELGKQIQTARDEEAAKKNKEKAEARVAAAAAEKERQERAEANARPILAACDPWVKRFDFERACQHLSDCTAKSDDADLKTKLQPRATELQLLVELKTTLLDKINSGAIPAFSCALARGNTLQGRPVAATTEAITIRVAAGTISFRWTALTEDTRYELLKQALNARDGRLQAAMTLYALESGRANEARQHFEQSKTLMGESLPDMIKQRFAPPVSARPVSPVVF